jgi:hypothetical protein
MEMQTVNASDVIEYGPVSVLVHGKTIVEKKLSVVAQASVATKCFLAAASGKVGKEARLGLAADGMSMIASSALRGNYKPLAEALASLTGETLTISNRSAFECLADRYRDRIADLKNGGYTTRKKDGVTVSGSKRTSYEQCITLIERVQAFCAAEIAKRQQAV